MFEVFEETIESDEAGSYVTYGIACIVKGVRNAISDVSLDKDKVQELVNRCNSMSLDPIHMQDVVEDFVFEDGLLLSR